MAFEDATPEVTPAESRLTEAVGSDSLLAPASREPLFTLLLGIVCFFCLIALSWLKMDHALQQGAKPHTPARAISQNARMSTYYVQLMWQYRLRGILPLNPMSTHVAVETAHHWEKLARTSGNGADQAYTQLNAAALYGVAQRWPQALRALQDAARRDAQLAGVARNLMPLYAEHPQAVQFSPATQQALMNISSGPIFHARNALLHGSTAQAITALQPGATAGVRVFVYNLIILALIFGVIIAAIVIVAVKHQRIAQTLEDITHETALDAPWGIGAALIAISMVFFLTTTFNSLLGGLFGAHNHDMQLAMGALSEIVSFLLVISVLLMALGRRPWEWAVLGWKASWRGVGYGLLIFILACPLVWLAGVLSVRIFGPQDATNPLLPLLQNTHSMFLQITLMLMAVVMAPVVEETLFRGLLLPALGTRLPFWTAAIISGILFALLHGMAFVMLPITILGVALAFIMRRSRNLLAPVVAHALQNGYVTMITLLTAWALHGPGR